MFELTEQMAVAEPDTAFQTIEPRTTTSNSPNRPSHRNAARAFEERVRERVEEKYDVAPPIARPLMSHTTVAAVNSAFNALAQTVLSNNARTLEDLVKEMLRPDAEDLAGR